MSGCGSGHDLDQGDARDRAGVEGREVDLQLVRVEADGNVEIEPRGDRGSRSGRRREDDESRGGSQV
jgi:hypothetical protein